MSSRSSAFSDASTPPPVFYAVRVGEPELARAALRRVQRARAEFEASGAGEREYAAAAAAMAEFSPYWTWCSRDEPCELCEESFSTRAENHAAAAEAWRRLLDCGECKSCRSMRKFGGDGRLKRACDEKRRGRVAGQF